MTNYSYNRVIQLLYVNAHFRSNVSMNKQTNEVNYALEMFCICSFILYNTNARFHNLPTFYNIFLGAILLFCLEMFDHIIHMLYIICRCYAIPSFVCYMFMSTHHCNEQYLVEHKGSIGGEWIYSIRLKVYSNNIDYG